MSDNDDARRKLLARRERDGVGAEAGFMSDTEPLTGMRMVDMWNAIAEAVKLSGKGNAAAAPVRAGLKPGETCLYGELVKLEAATGTPIDVAAAAARSSLAELVREVQALRELLAGACEAEGELSGKE